MRRLLVVSMCLILGVASAAIAQSGRQGHGGPGFGGPGGPGGMLAMLHQLNLTDAQKQQIKAMMDENRPAQPPQLPDLERQLHVAVLSGDTASVETLKTQLNEAHAQELNQRIEMLQRLAQILTPEQKQQLVEMHPRRGGH